MPVHQAGDRVVGGSSVSEIAGMAGTVLGYKSKGVLRVNFDSLGKRRVQEEMVVPQNAGKKEKKAKKAKKEKKEKKGEGLVKVDVEVTDLPTANGAADDEEEAMEVEEVAPAPLPAPPATNEPMAPAESVDLAALHLLYEREGYGVKCLKGHSMGGSWQIKTPTEVGVQEFAKGLTKMCPWYKKAIRANPEKPDFRAAAIECGNKPVEVAHAKLNGYLKQAQALQLDPSCTVGELLAAQDKMERLPYHYVEFHGEWRKCVVFKSEGAAMAGKHPVWLLTRNPHGWGPDVRVGVLIIPREDIYTKDSKSVEMQLRKTGAADVTRRAITLGDVFPSAVALERALLYFPQCFTPAPKDPNDEGFVQTRFAVRETVPFPPLPQYGNHPEWTQGSYRIALDQSMSFVPDTPTGGPLVSAPRWPDGVTDVCAECGRLVDPAAPGGHKGGTVLPGFIGRKNPNNPDKVDFLHTRGCVFAHKERSLSHLEITWKGGPGDLDRDLKKTARDLGAHRQLKTTVTTLPVDRRRDFSAETRAAEDNVWWVGDKGIIHMLRDGTHYRFLHFPKRKVAFLLQVDDTKVSTDTPFNEMHHAYGVVLSAVYCAPASPTYLRLCVDTRDRREAEVKQVAREAAAREASELASSMAETAADEEARLKKEDQAFAGVLKAFPAQVKALLDTASYLLETQGKADAKKAEKRDGSEDGDDERGSNAESESSDAEAMSDEPSEEAQRSEGSDVDLSGDSNSDEEDEEVGMNDKEFRPEAEDEGDEEEEINELDMDFQNTRKAAQRYLMSSREHRVRHRSITELQAYVETLRALEALAAEHAPLKTLLTNPLDNLTVINRYITAAEDMPGCEQNFPATRPVTREGEWRYLQETYGVGRPLSYYTENFLTPPYKKIQGAARGLYKALSFFDRSKYDELLVLEGLLLVRAVERRRNGTLAVIRPDVCEAASPGPALQKLYYEESLWFKAMNPIDAKELRGYVSRQLMLPEGRIQTAGNLVRVRGVQEIMRGGHELLHEGSAAVLGLAADQLWWVYQVGEALARDLGVHRGPKGRYVGAVTPHLTKVVNILRGVYLPVTATPATVHELKTALSGKEGLWVYEENSEPHRKIPLEHLLGKLPELRDGVEGIARAPARLLEAWMYVSDSAEEEDSEEENERDTSRETATVTVSYKFRDYEVSSNELSSKMFVQVLSGTDTLHEGDSTTMDVYQQSSVKRLLHDAGVRKAALVNAVVEACRVEGETPPSVAELYWLLLPAEGDRQIADRTYPWRFHSVFKRFGMTKKQVKRLKQLVDERAAPLLESSRTVCNEVSTEWPKIVRSKMFSVWDKLRRTMPEVEDEPEEDAGDIFAYALDGTAPPPDNMDEVSSVESDEAHGEDQGYETPCHGVDMHESSDLSKALMEVMRCDLVGKPAVMRALRRMTGSNGTQQFHWHETQLIATSGESAKGYGTMLQSDAARLAQFIIGQVRVMQTPEELDPSDPARAPYLPKGQTADAEADSESDWDEYSLAESDDMDEEAFKAKVNKKHASDALRADPFAVDGPLAMTLTDLPPTKFRGGCARTEVTLLNMYRFGEVLADRLAKADKCSFKFAELNFADGGELKSFAALLDNVLAAAYELGVARRGKGANAVATEHFKYKEAVLELWQKAGTGSGPSMEDDQSMASSDEHSDASDELSQKPFFQDWLSKLWDVPCAVSEELNVCEAVVQKESAFKFSVLYGLQHKMRVSVDSVDAKKKKVKKVYNLRCITEDTVKALDLIPLSRPVQPRRSFDSRETIKALPASGLGGVYGRMVCRQSLLVDDGTVLRRAEDAKRAGDGYVGLEVLRPFHTIYHGMHFGEVLRTKKDVPSFAAALSLAREVTRCCAFSWSPTSKEMVLHGVPESEATAEFRSSTDAGTVFCVLHAVRKDEGRDTWTTFAVLNEREGGTAEGIEKSFMALEETRPDPTKPTVNERFRTKAQFLKEHGQDGEAAWKASKMPEGRRMAPCEGWYATYRDYLQWAEENPDLPDGRFITEEQFVAEYSGFDLKGAAQIFWGQAEARRMRADKYPVTLALHRSSETARIARLWNRMEVIALPSVAPASDTPEKLYVLRPSDKLIASMRNPDGVSGDEDESEVQFTTYACLHYPWVRGFVDAAEKAGLASFVKEYGDFTTAPVYVYAVQDGAVPEEVVKFAKNYFKQHGVISSQCEFDDSFETAPLDLPKLSRGGQDAAGTLRELRLLADKSRTLQRLFKAREAAYPPEVFELARNLRSRYAKAQGSKRMLDMQVLKNTSDFLYTSGCVRVFAALLKSLGIKNYNKAKDMVNAKQIPGAEFAKAFTAVITENWSKPIPPAALPAAEEYAAKAGWLPVQEACDKINSVLRMDGAHGILDWAVRATLDEHKPLNITMREVSQMVNIVVFHPTEVRCPLSSATSELNVQKLQMEFELFDDSRGFEADGSAPTSIFDCMYTGHKVNPTKVHRKYFFPKADLRPVPIVDNYGAEVRQYPLYPVALVTERPIRLLSYKLRHMQALQAVGWEVRGALVPQAAVQKILNQRSDILHYEDCDGYDMTYLHRHSERLSRPIDETTFVPPLEHAVGRWMEGDRVDVFVIGKGDAEDRWHNGAIVESVDVEDGQPTVYLADGGCRTVRPRADHIKHAMPTPMRLGSQDKPEQVAWYGAVSYTPGQWSSHIEIADITPLIFTTSQAPFVQPHHKAVMNWDEVVEYQYGDAKDGEVKRFKMDAQGMFAVTRAGKGEGIEWEWGEFRNDNNSITGKFLAQGAPGAGRHPSVVDFAAFLEEDTFGNELGLQGKKYMRKFPKRMLLLSQTGESMLVQDYWNPLKVYDLVDGTVHQGQPVWKSADETSWLFAGDTGNWVVAMNLGDRALLRSSQTCDVVPGQCEFMTFNEDDGWTVCEDVFFTCAEVKNEAHNVHLQLKRLGVDRARMNELGFDADDEEAALEELNNQLHQRLVAETRVGEVWNRLRLATSAMHRRLLEWNKGSHDVKRASFVQCMHRETGRMVSMVRQMLKRDRVVEIAEFERDEDDAIADAAADLVRKHGYAEEVVAHWARQVRHAEGTLYHPNRKEILNQHQHLYPADKEMQAVLRDFAFLRHSDECLRAHERGLWVQDRWVPRLFNLTRDVLIEDAMAQGEGTVPVVVGAFGFSTKKLRLRQIINGVPEFLKQRAEEFAAAEGKSANPWWTKKVERSNQTPCVELVESLQRYFAAEMKQGDTWDARRERALDILEAIQEKCPSPGTWLEHRLDNAFTELKQALPSLPYWGTPLSKTSRLPRHYVDFDSASRGMALASRTPAPAYLIRRLENEAALRWPPLFDADTKETRSLGALLLESSPYERKAMPRWTQHYRDHLIMMETGMDEAREAVSKQRAHDYDKHKARVARAHETKKRYYQTGAAKQLRNKRERQQRTYSKTQSSKEAKAAQDLHLTKEENTLRKERQMERKEAVKEARKKYKKTEAGKEYKKAYRQKKKKEYRQTEAGKAKRREAAQRARDRKRAAEAMDNHDDSDRGEQSPKKARKN
eukprot:TRINITY_DN4560_c0_g3_i1.p1 TRINITY_DN4560_c0_g3~~TRINITY_DN4560_c0_g3_i1.p1  ORF type:complete len:3507 (+),score=1402.02 TRINITY_DN4560_c0_g3_i1:139-10659(+)